MTVFNTNNKKIIAYYDDYLKIKQLIDDLKLLKEYLLENRIIKQSKTYTVLEDDKYSYTYALKLDKILLRDYITNEQQELYLDISEKYYNYNFRGKNFTDLVYVDTIFIPFKKKNLENLTQFNFYMLERQKKIIKELIKAEFNNTPIRIFERYKNRI
jgi:hypothetical protein